MVHEKLDSWIHRIYRHFTLLSLNKFVEKGVHLDTENDRLQQNGKTFCMLEQHYDQWTLEFHEPPSILATIEADVPTTKSIWYQRLGHIEPQAVGHLPGLRYDGTMARWHDGTKGSKTVGGCKD